MALPLLAAPLIGGLLGALAGAMGHMVARVLVSLGIGYVTYQGVDTSITWARDFVFAKLGGLPADVLGIAGLMQVGTMISIVASALVVRVSIAGLIGGAKKMVVK